MQLLQILQMLWKSRAATFKTLLAPVEETLGCKIVNKPLSEIFCCFCRRGGGGGGFPSNMNIPNGNNYETYVDPNARKSNSSSELNVK